MDEAKNIFDFNEQPGKGKILLSEPFMLDPNFKRTVILLCEHNEEGSFGFVLNRKTKLFLKDAIPELKSADLPLYYGGPVEPGTLHYLHTLGDQVPDSQEIADGVFWGGDFEVMLMLVQGNQLKEDQVKFFVGYSGWGPEQIKEELQEDSWFVTQGRADDIFNDDETKLWSGILKELGGDYKSVANYPEDPNLN